MTPLFTLGSLYVTPYSLAVFAGALVGAALAWRKKQVRPLIPAVILGALLIGHLAWVLFCPYDYEAAEGKLYMILRPWQGGYTLYGALLGGAAGALVAGKAAGVRWADALDALAPGACAAIVFARIGEVFTGEGIGRQTEVAWTHFFPVSVCTYADEYFEEWRYVVWFWEALAALVLLAILLKREKRAKPGSQTLVFVAVLGLTQILLEQMRRDNYLRIIIFVRVSQLAAIATLLGALAVLLVRRRPAARKVLASLAAFVLAALAIMAAEFVFDKYEYAPWLYAALAASAAGAALLLAVYRQRKALLPAAVFCAVSAVLIAGYACKDWDSYELTVEEDLLRELILYAAITLNLSLIGGTLRLNCREGRG